MASLFSWEPQICGDCDKSKKICQEDTNSARIALLVRYEIKTAKPSLDRLMHSERTERTYVWFCCPNY